jgi:hypothetical protein
MRNIFFIFFLFVSFLLNAQINKIKIQKEDSSKVPVVSLCGKTIGEVSLTELCSNTKFRISNNSKGYKVNFAIAGFKTSEGNYVEWVISSDSLNKRIIQELLKPKAPAKTKMKISDIKAINKAGEEIILNDLIITINK